MSVVWMTDETSMSSVVSVLLAVAGFVPLLLALSGPTPGAADAGGAAVAAGSAGTLTRVRPRTALQVAACLFTADVPWGIAQVAAERVNAGEVDVDVLVEWLDGFGETATVFALVAGMGTDDLRAILSGQELIDIDSLRLLATLKGEI